MTNNPLTETEYNSLAEYKQIFDLLAAGVKDLPNPSGSWLLQMQSIYARVFNAPKPSLACPPCRLSAIERLLPSFKQYEAEQAKIALESNPISNEQSTSPSNPTESSSPDKNGIPKGRGRRPKQW